jgi:hypothetical protein
MGDDVLKCTIETHKNYMIDLLRHLFNIIKLFAVHIAQTSVKKLPLMQQLGNLW